MTGLVDRHPLKEKRRANKPLLERKRRAKINDSLTDLKHLVLSSLNKDVSKYAKMEKVDILDMTVRFLKGRCLDQHQDDCTSMYRAGHRECTKQMYQNIMTMDGLDHAMKCRILSNLANYQRDEPTLSPPPSPTLSDLTSPDSPTSISSPHKMFEPPRPGQYINAPPPSQHNSRLFMPPFHQKPTPAMPPLIHKPVTPTPLPHLHSISTTKRPSSSLWRPW